AVGSSGLFGPSEPIAAALLIACFSRGLDVHHLPYGELAVVGSEMTIGSTVRDRALQFCIHLTTKRPVRMCHGTDECVCFVFNPTTAHCDHTGETNRLQIGSRSDPGILFAWPRESRVTSSRTPRQA